MILCLEEVRWDHMRIEPRSLRCWMNKKRLVAGERMNSGKDMTLVFYVEALDDLLLIRRGLSNVLSISTIHFEITFNINRMPR